MLDKKERKGHTGPSENPEVSAYPNPVVDVVEEQRSARLTRIARKMSRSLGILASVKAALEDLRHGRVRSAEDLEREFAISKKA